MEASLFDKPHNEAFSDLGAQRPAREWSMFDVPTKEAEKGKARFLLTTIWNYHSELDHQDKRVKTEVAICKDMATGTYWYRMTNASSRISRRTHVAHMKRMDLAFRQNVSVIGILKDVDSEKCASSQLFDCPEIRESVDGKSIWLRLVPHNGIACETKEIDIDQLAKPSHGPLDMNGGAASGEPPEGGWSESELEASVAAYLDMARRFRDARPVVKRQVYRDLAAQIGRSEKSCEYRMRNISYVLELMGRDWIPGLPPATNVGVRVAGQIEALIGKLEGRQELPRAAEAVTIAEIRKTLDERPDGNKAPGTATSTTTSFVRDLKVKAWVLKRAKDNCEACDQPAPFSGANGPFLEVHHLRKLADGGSDTVTNAVAVCPNCHRRLHFSKDARAYRETIYEKVTELVRE
ncbi:HNH endonuclease signature motif containing protein [Burkholderia thailandensis]|uniref:HNH endonuclease n=1 Tax=Burkholderia thailandensis TaxID=57975 RepID=UPI0004F85AC1|nr:HNH endonuclease signature motif containing protein [Burkholderia thailandensis]